MINKRYLGALVGNIMQFYDFTIYAFLTTEISQTFFNFQNKFLSYFVVFSIFAGGYLTRPLGSLIFGYVGDKKGRSNALSKTIIISAIATLALNIFRTGGPSMPSGYDAKRLIGFWATDSETCRSRRSYGGFDPGST